MSSAEPAGVAIVGLAGRFPGAPDAATFWNNVCAGVDSVARFEAAQLEDAFDSQTRAAPNFVGARSVLAGAELFDAAFFGMHAREAELTDPQHRIFLECCWQALEDAGYDPGAYSGAIGVFAGCSINTYFLRHVLQDRVAIERFTSDYQADGYPELLGAGHDFLATRVAYKLDLRGPAMTLQSACSTSLLAVAQASQTLLLRQADMMLAGAVSITFPQARGYLHQPGGITAADGRCRTFDQGASGTVFGAGCGVVVLKRLEDAVADGDTIYAVIRGFGVNNDGSAKVGYTAPSMDGQAAAISAAHAMAGVDAASIQYVECHGTATPLGDPIEFAALAKAFGTPVAGVKTCALGSVKTNVGHLDVAAGMSGLIKTALAIRYGTLPPSLHFNAPNPRIDLAASPFYVNTALTDWPGNVGRRRAGVSAFGLGGTNVHLLLENEPERAPAAGAHARQLLVLSARSEPALAAARARLSGYLQDRSGDELADIAFTLQAGRRTFEHRCAVTAATPREAVAKLDLLEPAACGPRATGDPVVAFMFPGQGAQYAGMGRELYAELPVFRKAIDRCAIALEPHLHADLRTVLYAWPVDAVPQALTATALAQPAIFAVEYALAQVWLAWGIRPAATIGHSVGEFVAACLAGVMSLEDALWLVAERGRLMQALPAGGMLAVRLSESDLRPLLAPPLALAAVNSGALCVVAGPLEALFLFEGALVARGVTCRRIDTSHAFHSPMMDPILGPLAERIGSISLEGPASPYVSGVSGDWMSDDRARSPEYWARHCREPVLFEKGLTTLLQGGVTALLEVGPGTALAGFAAHHAGRNTGVTVAGSLPGSGRERPDLDCMLGALGSLWSAGARPDWRAVHAPFSRRRVPAPTYPFEGRRHWIDPQPRAAQNAAVAQTTSLDTTRIEEHVVVTPAFLSDSADAEVQRRIVLLLEGLSGERIAGEDVRASFLELGFDSLFLGRFAQSLRAEFNVDVTFRQLMADLPSISTVAKHIAATVPGATVAPPSPDELPQSAAASASTASVAPVASVESLMRDQLQTMQQLMREQLQVLQQMPGTAREPLAANATRPAVEAPAAKAPVPADDGARFNVFRQSAGAPVCDPMTEAQRAHIDALTSRTVARTNESKRLTQRYRPVLADPRVAAGFRSEWKEMVYPITCVRAEGSRLWDVDGNEYVDLVNGFGQTAFGHSSQFVVDAVREQLSRGFAIGPQTELAGEVATLFCELTGNERVTFCNTGSEAVMAALRVARTVTSRNRVVLFGGAYHGQFDEVLVKAARTPGRSLPVAPGIPPESVANVTVLPYAAPESLSWIREHAAELAAVVVEPVQSRHPALQPHAFLRELRDITQAAEVALVFDEVVTGFRMHPGGMQAVFGVRADLATYGKVVGGGLPIGILAGTARYMDSLDGGMWAYGDDSAPEVAPTFFAGTFVRHPLVMAAVLAVLRHLKAQGPALQESLTARTAGLVRRLNADFARRGVVTRIETYGSLFYFSFAAEDRLAGLLYYHLRNRGVYVQEGFPCFLTVEHSEADVERVVNAFAESLDELAAVDILNRSQIASAGLEAQVQAPRNVRPTEEQTEIWLAAQLGDDASCAFNEAVTLRFRGALDPQRWRQAFERVCGRHDAFQATFSPTGEVMRIAPSSPTYDRSDASADGEKAAEAALEALVAREARTPFDLVHGPLVRGHLLRLGPDSHAFVLTAHHIVCDGWSMNVVLEELTAIYDRLCDGRPLQLPPPMPFSTYAKRQRQRDPADLARIEKFWCDLYREPVAPLDLPTDRPRPALRSFDGATRSAHLDAAEYVSVKKAGARYGCTLFVTLLTAFQALVGRLCDRTDVVTGVPAAGQALLEDTILVGHCVDFLPLRARWNPQTRLVDLLGSVKRDVLDAYEHQSYTLGTLVRALKLRREANRVPLAELQFNLERLTDRMLLPSVDVEVTPNPKAFVNFDLFLNVIESEAGLRFDCDYNTDLFDAETIDRFLAYYKTMLRTIVADATTLVSRVDYLPPQERAAILESLTGTATPYPEQSTIHSLFEAQAAVRPNALAVRCGDERLSYDALNRRANRLADLLRSRVPAGGKRVAVLVDRSSDMVVALLAVLKADCAYVPLDPSHPAARLRYVLSDSGAAALITSGSSEFREAPSGVAVIDLGRDREELAGATERASTGSATSDDLAYVIYTSGSTGRPKGVEVTHRSVANLLWAMKREPGLDASDVLLAVTTIAFDIAALEIFLPLVTGATVAIAPTESTRDGYKLLEELHACSASVLQATPATWRVLLEAGFVSRPGFRMLVGGEALARELADGLLAGGGELWNMYGPTETTIWSSCKRIVAGNDAITVGRPIANTRFYVLDSAGELVPLGQAGHLHIGGDGVARGYVNLQERSAASFIRDPFRGARMYRTGDLARIVPGGECAILGRLDQQVKLRGFRIELGEIEAAMMRKAALSACAVVLREDVPGSPRLVGYYVERADAPTPGAVLHALLAQDLPDYMIPSIWMPLKALPLNASGKVDRAALPMPESGAASPEYREPQTRSEKTLAQIWSEVLQIQHVGTLDDLFELGADSIHLFQITARANQQGIPLLAKHLLAHRTIDALARHIESGESAPADVARLAARTPAKRARRPLVAELLRDDVARQG